MKNTLLTITILSTLALILIIGSNKNDTTKLKNSNSEKSIENNIKSGSFSVDSKNSNIEWLGRKTTGTHNGNIIVQEGIIEIDEQGNISAGKFVLDMQSINCTDLADKPKKKKYFEDHLKDSDFFDVTSHPNAGFSITKVNNDTMSGMLTIKGISQEINFNYHQTDTLTYEAKIIVDRTLFDIKYKSKSIFPDIGDNFIDDNFIITLNPIVFK